MDPGFDRDALRRLSAYWEGVRYAYGAFESDMRAGSASVFEHGMPGGQYTNLREQARALGLHKHWPEVERAYAEVNELFGDIIKVTPTSKVVGDMALTMVSSGISAEAVADPNREMNFPASVVQLFKGELGRPIDGFPPALQRKVLKGGQPLTTRPGAALPPADLAAERREAERKARRSISENELASYLMYPQVFLDYAAHRRKFSDVSVLPTPEFFYGPEPDPGVRDRARAGEDPARDLPRGRRAGQRRVPHRLLRAERGSRERFESPTVRWPGPVRHDARPTTRCRVRPARPCPASSSA